MRIDLTSQHQRSKPTLKTTKNIQLKAALAITRIYTSFFQFDFRSVWNRLCWKWSFRESRRLRIRNSKFCFCHMMRRGKDKSIIPNLGTSQWVRKKSNFEGCLTNPFNDLNWPLRTPPISISQWISKIYFITSSALLQFFNTWSDLCFSLAL